MPDHLIQFSHSTLLGSFRTFQTRLPNILTLRPGSLRDSNFSVQGSLQTLTPQTYLTSQNSLPSVKASPQTLTHPIMLSSDSNTSKLLSKQGSSHILTYQTKDSLRSSSFRNRYSLIFSNLSYQVPFRIKVPLTLTPQIRLPETRDPLRLISQRH